MFNSHLYEKLVQAHAQELLQEAEQQRLAAQAVQEQPQLMQKAGRWFAAWLAKLPLIRQKAQYVKRTATGQL